jgi:hypothetical protein
MAAQGTMLAQVALAEYPPRRFAVGRNAPGVYSSIAAHAAALLLAALLVGALSGICAAQDDAAAPTTGQGGAPSSDAKTAKQSPKNQPAPTNFEGLGFSIAPRDGGRGKTSFFGVVGEGYKFVYVLDRSGSMGGRGRESLRAVKAELIESLKNLDSVHQFQIVFYNEQPVVFNPTGNAARLAFATDENKDRAVRFVDTIAAAGGTCHEAALRLALRLQPDVIFLLTDGDEPKLTPEQFRLIRRLAAGVIINTIEFGSGPKPEGESFLEVLASQNGGKYAYVDISQRAAESAASEPPSRRP